MTAPYKIREAGSLKQAVAALVEANGGQTAVAGLLGCSAQHVARMTDDNHPKTQMPIEQVVMLEMRCGQCHVTEWMAAEQGCVVEKIHLGDHASLPIILGRIGIETGELLSAAAHDMQRGVLTVTNASRVIDEVEDVLAAALVLLAAAKQVKRGAA